MKSLSRQDLEKQLKESSPGPLYLLVGPETFLRDRTVQKLTDVALAGTLLREFNETTFSLFTESASDAVAAAEQLPMMSDRRVVRLKHFSKLRERDEEVLIGYLNNPVPSTVMIFIAEDLHKGKRLSKILLDKCVVVDFPSLKDADAKFWVNSRLKSLKTTIDEPALNQLMSLVGTDIQTLNSELEKLASAAIEQGHISRDLVDSLIGRSRELSNFELGNHLVAGNRKGALRALHQMLEDDVPELLLLGIIASNYHRLFLAKEMLNRGLRDEVSRMVPSWKRNEFLASLQKNSSEKLTIALTKIAAADLAIKTSQATPRLQLELLVCELAKN